MPQTPSHYLALDTNIFINHFPLVAELHQNLIKGSTWLLVPATVVTELDGLKTQRKFNNGSRNHTENVGFKAQKATNWLLELMRAERRAPGTTRLRGERWSEQPVVQREGVRADDTILGCCMHFQDEAPVTLWSDDRNLCLTAESNGIPTVGGPKVGLADLKKAVAGAAAVAAGAAAMSMEVDGVVVADDDDDDSPLAALARERDSRPSSAPPDAAQTLPGVAGPSSAMMVDDSHDYALRRLTSLPRSGGVAYAKGSLAEAVAAIDPDNPSLPGSRKRSHAQGPATVARHAAGTAAPRRHSDSGELRKAMEVLDAAHPRPPAPPPPKAKQPQPRPVPKPVVPDSSPASNPRKKLRPSTEPNGTAIPSLTSTTNATRPTTTTASTATTRTPRLPPAIALRLFGALVPVSHSLAAHLTRPPPTATTDLPVLANVVTTQLEDLDKIIPPGHEMQRALSRCIDAARTVRAFVAEGGERVKGGELRKRPRSGQAADAVLVLMGQLRELRVATDDAQWRGVAGALRGL